MLFDRSRNITLCELLLHYLKEVAGYLGYLDTCGGVIEEPIAATAEAELVYALEDINTFKAAPLLSAACEAVGDVCFLFSRLLQDAQQYEAIMQTFESVRDAALQEAGCKAPTAVREVDKKELQKVIDYYFRARALMVHPAERYGVDLMAALDIVSGFVM